MIVLVLGPHGSGKSTLVRRIMRPREWTHIHRTGPLPWGYRSKDLVVYGNYERTSRSRHGMCSFDRDPIGNDMIMRSALDERLPVLMEGGYERFSRLQVGYGPTFASRVRVIYLDVVGDPVDRLGRKLTIAGCESYRDAHVNSMAAIELLGGSCEILDDREIALSRVCELLDLQIPNEPIQEDYR